MAVALSTRPLEQRGSIPHLRPTAGQRARPAELSGQQGGLWLHAHACTHERVVYIVEVLVDQSGGGNEYDRK